MRYVFLTYAVACYLAFLGTFLYLVGFVGNFMVPKSMDTGAVTPLAQAMVINALLIVVFAMQHSVMARQSFKQKWTRWVPPAIERSTYVLFSSLALVLLFWQWRPMGDVIWDVSGTPLGTALIIVSLVGWLIVLISTFLIDHFELFGLKQVYLNLSGRELQYKTFRTPAFYKLVRHPIYFGFAVAFWATPVMTTAHLLFATGMLAYMLMGIHFEEQDLVKAFGDEYRKYKSRVSMLVPWPQRLG